MTGRIRARPRTAPASAIEPPDDDERASSRSTSHSRSCGCSKARKNRCRSRAGGTRRATAEQGAPLSGQPDPQRHPSPRMPRVITTWARSRCSLASRAEPSRYDRTEYEAITAFRDETGEAAFVAVWGNGADHRPLRRRQPSRDRRVRAGLVLPLLTSATGHVS